MPAPLLRSPNVVQWEISAVMRFQKKTASFLSTHTSHPFEREVVCVALRMFFGPFRLHCKMKLLHNLFLLLAACVVAAEDMVMFFPNGDRPVDSAGTQLTFSSVTSASSWTQVEFAHACSCASQFHDAQNRGNGARCASGHGGAEDQARPSGDARGCCGDHPCVR